MRRKRLALLAGQIDERRQSRFLQGFLEQSFADDMDVCVFSMYRKYMSTLIREKGESNIFTLFDPKDFDGIVILKDSIQIQGSTVPFEEHIKETFSGPVLIIDRESDFFESVFQDDYSGMAMMISHLIEVHGFKDIAYVSGRKGHLHAVNRLQAYRDTMEKHGLQVREERIFHGDFWYSSGNNAVKTFADSNEGLPEAIVCANDEMAIGVCAELESKGFSIPKDIAVAGFDSTDEGRLSPLSITSADMPYEEIGKYASRYISAKLRGEDVPCYEAKPEFMEGETCGCENTDLSIYDPQRKFWTTDRISESNNDINNMLNRDLLNQNSLEEFFGTLFSYAYQIEGARNFSLCMVPDWKKLATDSDVHVRNNGFPKKMIRVLRYDSISTEGNVDMDAVFQTKDLLPELSVEQERPSAYIFTPFYCEEECFGYAAVSYGEIPRGYDENYRKWMEDVECGFELLRRTLILLNYRNYIENMKKMRLNIHSVSYDSLTPEEKKECALVEEILDKNLLTYVFQPIVRADNGEIYSYEALMRSNTSTRVSPLSILKYAGILGKTREVEKKTLTNILTLMENFPEDRKDTKIFINSIPGANLTKEEYAPIFEMIRRHADQTVVEFTEESELNDNDLQLYKNTLSELGVQIAIDDYGTGYSNINNLIRYMPNFVKIDRTLISGIENAPQKKHFVSEIIKFCQDNKISSLAEGVETADELCTVIQMGVDFIQGYYTGKPSPEMLPGIDSKIQKEIVKYYQERDVGISTQVYQAGNSNRISLSLLVKYGYTDIIVGYENAVHKDLTIVGAPNLPTDIHLQVLPGYSGKITLENAQFANVKGRPCIAIGEGSNVILELKGNNTFRGIGISVAPSSSLTLTGDGNLKININESNYYGIGNDFSSKHGDIHFAHNGTLSINGNGQEGICIGSGLGGPIDVRSGQYMLTCGGTRCVAFGAVSAPADLVIVNCNMEIDQNANVGVAIGSLLKESKTYITRSSVKILVSGNVVSGVGTTSEEQASVCIEDANVEINIRSNDSTCLGSLQGKTELRTASAGIRLENAGKNALAVGGVEKETKISLLSTDTRVDIHNSLGRDTFAEEKDISIEDGRIRFTVNDQNIERELKFNT